MKRPLLFGIIFAAIASIGAAATTPAFPFTYYVHDTTGKTADAPLESIYQFAATPLGSNSNVVLKAVNSSQNAAFLGDVLVTANSSSTELNRNFTVTGLANDLSVPVGGSFIFTVNFSPIITGPVTAYLQTSYQVQQGSCIFTSNNPATQCPSGLNVSGTLTGMATAPQLVLSYQSSGGTVILQPSATPLNFGNVSTSSTAAITFTLTNQSTVSVNVPSITVPAPTVYSSTPFLLDTSGVPTVLAGGQSANFTITFEPGQTGLATTSILLGSSTFPIQGEGVIVADIDALQISDVDSTGVRNLPQAATPIAFGQTVAGTGATNVLTFTVTNPSASFNDVVVPSITVSGAGFVLSAMTGASSFPASVAPGASITFQIVFSGNTSGRYTGTLSIGARVFSLTGLTVSSPLPNFSLAVYPSPLSSQQQATVAVNLASPSALDLLGTISLAFTPSVNAVTGDPAIMFLQNGGNEVSLSIASGGQVATSNGQSALTFQTGTTAGTIMFSVAFPNTPPFTQSYTITPGIVQITSASAVRSNPNLVVSLAGYDNTYSASQLNFTFYDVSGNVIGAPIAVNAAGNFQNLFFTNNQSGGAFSLQATFPVTGDVTKVGSVAVAVINSVGQANTRQTFQ